METLNGRQRSFTSPARIDYTHPFLFLVFSSIVHFIYCFFVSSIPILSSYIKHKPHTTGNHAYANPLVPFRTRYCQRFVEGQKSSVGFPIASLALKNRLKMLEKTVNLFFCHFDLKSKIRKTQKKRDKCLTPKFCIGTNEIIGKRIIRTDSLNFFINFYPEFRKNCFKNSLAR